MENDNKYDEIQEQVKILNDKLNSAVSEEDWQNWNTQMNKVGKLIEEYGRTRYDRTKKINIILGIE
jgi:flagellar biosynthesis chaperone FliJ